MVRLSNNDMGQRDEREVAMFNLGSALAYLALIEIRVRQAAIRQPDLMQPAVNDLAEVRELIRQSQTQIGQGLPVAARACNR